MIITYYLIISWVCECVLGEYYPLRSLDGHKPNAECCPKSTQTNDKSVEVYRFVVRCSCACRDVCVCVFRFFRFHFMMFFPCAYLDSDI